jgi:hypothetical protein
MTKQITAPSGRQAGKNYQHLIDTYIGLSDAQLEVIERIPTNFDKAPKNVQSAMIARRLFTSEGEWTHLASSVARVYAQIQTGSFTPAGSSLTEKETLVLNDPQLIARQAPSKKLGLVSGHIKFLRSVLQLPGISIFTMEKIFGVHLFNELISRGLLSRDQYSHRIYPTNKGEDLVCACIAAAVEKKASKSNKGRWRFVCRTCKREYPENGDGLSEGINPSGHPVKLCECGGVVDLSPTKKKGVKNG